MNANVFKPAMAAMVVAIAATGLVACNGTSDKSEPLSKITEPPAAAATAEPATPAAPDIAATTPATTATTPDSAATTPDTTASTDAQPAISSRTMTAKEESTAMPMHGQANDHSTPETKPIPKN